MPPLPKALDTEPLNEHHTHDHNHQGDEEAPEHSWSECCDPPNASNTWDRQWGGAAPALDHNVEHLAHERSEFTERELPIDTSTSVVEQVGVCVLFDHLKEKTVSRQSAWV